MSAALRFEGITKSYGDKVALRGVSLDVAEGEVFGLLGPNGAGKTSLLRIGLDILRPDSGEVEIFGAPLSRESLDRVTYLPEERGLYKKTKVLDALRYFGQLTGMSRRDATREARVWLQRIGLPHVEKENVEALSKGMSQKVQVASALISDPALCILDEPFSGLDPVNMDDVKSIILERRERGRTTILSTHMMNQVEALCDRIALISDGQRVLYGTIDEVRRVHGQRTVRIKAAPALSHEDAQALVEGLIAFEVRQGFVELRVEDTLDLNEVLARLIAGNIRVQHFEEVFPTMEEIFIRAVRESKS